MPSNPNWPRLQALWAPTGHIGYGPSATSYELLPWVDVSDRLIGPWQINRGRQYELDQVTTGTWSGVLDNRDGLFDPGNTGSGVGGNVVPYQPFRIRAQWPVTVNLLTAGQANASSNSVPLTPDQAGWSASSAVTQFHNRAPTGAFYGGYVFEAVAAASAAGATLSTLAPVTAGATYTFSIRIRCTTGTAPQVLAFSNFYTAAGTGPTVTNGAATTLTSGATGWTELTVTATAPATIGYAALGVLLSGPSPACTVQIDGAQFEIGTSASGFVLPGNWYPLFTGGIERYPQTWRASGTLGFIQATAVDALALLSQSLLDDPFTAAAFKPSGGPAPAFAYLLADAGGTFVDATGQRPAAQVGVNLYGGGTVTPGTPRTSAGPAGSFVCPVGTTAVNLGGLGAAGTSNSGVKMSFIRLPGSTAGAVGPGAAGTGFTRMIAFRVTAAPTVESAVWMATTGASAGVFSAAGLLVNPDLSVSAVMMDPAHQAAGSTRISLGAADVGNWHLAFFWMSADGSSWGGSLDGAWSPAAASPPYAAMPFGAFRDDVIGAAFWGAFYPDACQYNLDGDVALATEWPGVLTQVQVQAVFSAWKTGWGGDSTDVRFGRILTAAGWNGPTLIDAGVTASMAPATDIAAVDAVTALQAVTDTEGGVMFADAAGNMVFQARTRRWNPPPATVVFGENAAGSELPYTDSPLFDFDPTLVTNLAEVTHSASGAVFTAADYPSQNANGVRERTVTSQAASTQECQDKAQFLVVRYKTPRTRVASMTVTPSANPSMWPTVLGLDIGARAKAVRRPAPPAATVTVDGFVENLAWSVDITGDATLTVQLSPADPTPYGRFDVSTFGSFVFGY